MGRGLRLCVALPMNNAQGTPVPVEYPVRKRASVPSGIIIPLSKRNATVTLADVEVGLMQGMDTWEGTANELLVMLDGATAELPVDATRLSKALNKLASQLAVRGVAVEHVKTAKRRGIRLLRRYGA